MMENLLRLKEKYIVSFLALVTRDVIKQLIKMTKLLTRITR